MNIPSPMNKGAPPSPDYAGAAREQTVLNRPNQSTPWATSTWTSGRPGAPAGAGGFGGGMAGVMGQQPARDSQSVQLAGPLGDANNSMMSQLGSAWSSPLDDGQQARQHAEDALYSRATARLDPMWNQRETGLQTSLANSGLDINSEAGRRAQTLFGNQRNDAYSSALNDAISGGGAEAGRQQQMDLMSRMAPLEGMSGLRGLTGMPGVPGAGNLQQAAGQQGAYGLQAADMNQKFWSDLISNGSKLAAAAG